MTENTDLIVHIGQGKTGTSSIQKALSSHKERLSQNSYKYLQLNLEECINYSENLDYLDEENLGLVEESEVYKCLKNELVNKGGNTLIWSNERLFTLTPSIPVLRKLKEDGFRIHIITYVRRHDLWSRSAHIQWGIKHKMKPGAVMSYSQWLKKTSLEYADQLRKWQSAFPDDFSIRNYEEISDVVSDFSEFLRIPATELAASDINISPGKEMLYAWSIFNSMSNKANLPYPFENFLKQQRNLNQNFDKDVPKADLLPKAEEINQSLEDNRADIEEVNEILTSHGQKAFHFEPVSPKDTSINDDKLIELLFKMTFNQQKQINSLTRRLNELGSH